MTRLYEFKERLRQFYGNYSAYINPILKFGIALAVFININIMLGFMPLLNNVFVVLILALLCSILPVNAIAVFGSFLIIGHCYVIGVEVAAFALVLFILLLILFVRFTPKDGIMLVLTPLAMHLNLPAMVPLGLGLARNGASCISAACGAIIYYFMLLVKEKSVTMESEELSEITARLNSLLDGMVQRPELWLTVIAFIAVVLLVSSIRRASFDYAWTISVLVGSLFYPIFMMAGSYAFDLGIDLIPMMLGSLITFILTLLINLFVFSVDYSRSEYIQYEDDDYYYYVKAVPKIRVSAPERSVKKIEADSDQMLQEKNDENPERK